jgi:hypothetical protein
MTTNSHRHCDHDATKAARAACRKLRAQGIDTTLGVEDLAANRLHRANPDHTRNCCWHQVMSVSENWAVSQVEDPTAEWCKGEPTVDYLIEQGACMLDACCLCD